MQIRSANIDSQLHIRSSKLSNPQTALKAQEEVVPKVERQDKPAVIQSISMHRNSYEYTIEDAAKERNRVESQGDTSQETGVKWERLAKELGELNVGFSHASELPVEDFEKRMDVVASRYAVVKDQIMNSSPLAEKKTHFSKLENIAATAISYIKDSYSDFMKDELGSKELGGKIRASVGGIFEDKVTQYAKAIRANPNYAGVKEEDKWLEADDAYMASQLRKEANVTEGTPLSLFSMSELKAAGSAALQFSPMKEMSVYAGLSEEEMGLDLSVLGMQTEYMLKENGMKPELANTVRSALNSFVTNYMDAHDKGWKQALDNDKYGLKTPQTIDREAVKTQYEYTMKEYERTGDFVDAIQAGVKQAQNVYGDKYQSEAYADNARYTERNQEDLTNFFERDTNPSRIFKHSVESSTYEKYLTVIGSFCESVDQKDFGQFDFNLQPWGIKESNPEGTLSYIEAFRKIDVRA